MRIETWRTDAGDTWRVAVTESRRERRRGLLGIDELPPGTGLAFIRCRSVHTVAMRFPIDVVMLDDELVVRRVVTARPWRVVVPRVGARHVLEIAAGHRSVRPGDRFVVQATSSTSPDRRTTTVRGVSDGTAARAASAARRRWSIREASSASAYP